MITLAIYWEAILIALAVVIGVVGALFLFVAAYEASSNGKLWGKIVICTIITTFLIAIFWVVYDGVVILLM